MPRFPLVLVFLLGILIPMDLFLWLSFSLRLPWPCILSMLALETLHLFHFDSLNWLFGGTSLVPLSFVRSCCFCSYSHRGFLKCLSSCEVCCFLPSLRGPVVWLCDWLFSICLSCLLQLFVLLVPILGPLPGIRFCLNGEGILSLGSPWCFTLFVGLICSLTFCVRCAVTLQTVGRLTIGSWR